ncbi:MAG TPA: hypothetical protein DCQ36_08450, partial [Actinobacteria bacterium]|nr:hypothetical protein [Actinomycetota bacterium]
MGRCALGVRRWPMGPVKRTGGGRRSCTLGRGSVMGPEDRQARYDAAIAVAREAGAVALRHFRHRGDLTIESKGQQDLVSEADRETEAVIKDRLSALFPDDGFVGEESG